MAVRNKLAAALLAPLLCVGCANMEMTRSGFLEDYEELEPAPEREVWGVPDEVDFFEAPGVDWARYQALIVDPVEFVQGEDRAPDADAEDRAKMAARFTEILEQRLAEDFTLVQEPGPNTLRLRAAVTDADCSNIWVNWIGVILIVPPDMGGISGELEVLDATSGERLLALTATREGTPFLLIECFWTWGHAGHGMKKWARMIAETMRPEDSEGSEDSGSPEATNPADGE